MALPAYVTVHKGDSVLKYYWLIEIQCSPVQRLTNADQNIVYGGQVYYSTRSLVFDNLSSNEADRDIIRMGVKIGNVGASGGTPDNGAFGALVWTFIGTLRAPAATIYEVWGDAGADNVAIAPGNGYALISGRVDSPSWDSEWVTFTVVPTLDGSAEKIPSLIYGSTCVHRRFKGSGCGYAGAGATCNRSFAQCTTYGNTNRFLGFQHLPPDDAEFGLGANGEAVLKPRKRT